MKILVVDDEPNICSAFRRLLYRAEKYDFVCAHDGQEGIDKIRNEGPIDLILTDINMPRMDGIQMVNILRQAGNNTPIIVMSGGMGSLQEEAKKLFDNGKVQGFLPKPWPTDPQVVIELMKKAMGRQ